MTDVVIVIPRDIVDSLRIPPGEASRRLRIELALSYMRRGSPRLGRPEGLLGYPYGSS